MFNDIYSDNASVCACVRVWYACVCGTHACARACHVCVCMCICTGVWVYSCGCVVADVCMCMYICMYACICACKCRHVCVCLQVYKCLKGFNNERNWVQKVTKDANLGAKGHLKFRITWSNLPCVFNRLLINFQVSAFHCGICVPFLTSSSNFKKFPPKMQWWLQSLPDLAVRLPWACWA